MSKFHRYFVAAALTIAAAATPKQLSAQIALTPGFWQEFINFDPPGPVDGDGFSAQSAVQVIRVRVTDAFTNGDAYDIFIDGVLAYQTPTVQGDGYFEEFVTDDPDLAYGNSLLSWYEFFLAPQVDPYVITLYAREAPPDAFGGGGFIRMDLQTDVTPEPGAIVLLATGLVGIAVFGRRRTLRSVA